MIVTVVQYNNSVDMNGNQTPAIARPLTPLKILAPLLDSEDYRILGDPAYFSPYLESLHSPLSLDGMEHGVDLLRKHIEKKSRIFVLGDRDVDGVASSAMLGGFLRDSLHLDTERLEMRVSDDGDDYGLGGEILQTIIHDSAHLLILLDMGSAHGAAISEVVKSGKDVIVLDHHQLQDPPEVTESVAFINPLKTKDDFEHQGLTPTVSVILKFLLGYAISYTKEWNTIRIYDLKTASGKVSFAYRIGKYLGSYSSEKAPEEALDLHSKGWVFLPGELDDDPAFIINDPLRDRIIESPVYAGSFLFARFVRHRPRLREFFLRQSDLTALGMITDMVPLVGENRSMVRAGMGRLESGRQKGGGWYRTGYRALIQNLKIPENMLLSREMGWSIGPVLNAAGRMGKTALALELLMESDTAKASELAGELVKLNRNRKSRTAGNEKIMESVFEKRPVTDNEHVVFCYHPDLEPGVSGIMATRLTEKYERPAVYINPDGEYARGSVRSWNNWNVLELLSKAGDLLIQFGGHAGAAGFSVEFEKIEPLRKRLLEAAQLVSVRPESGAKEQPYHMEVTPGDLNYQLMDELDFMEPFGESNPEPLLFMRNVKITETKFMSEGLHLRFQIEGTGKNVWCIAWKNGPSFLKRGGADIAWNLYGCFERSFFAGRNETRFRVETMIPIS